MKFSVVTLFPEIIRGFFQDSIMARSVERGNVEYDLVQIRDYAFDRHRTCDDAPYGGGAGMILKPEPLGRALEAVGGKNKRVVFPTPTGKPFTQRYAQELAGESELVIVCGRYEGIDQRIIDLYVDDEISIGDYVISSGEIAALVIIDAVYRLIDGVISKESLVEESFSDGLLEYPQYTRPAEYCGISVPDVLLSGHHAQVEQWRLVQRIRKTLKNRPDLVDQAKENPELQQLIDTLQQEEK
ncbi:MAG: tRNA (guanosine(37)-N1)-methyltransferase TrmD [Spirochaetota bacterium]